MLPTADARPWLVLLLAWCVAVAAIAGCWIWIGSPVSMPASPLAAGEKLFGVSYTPFRRGQSPLDPSDHVAAGQIEDDLARLAGHVRIVRTYSAATHGLDQVAAIASRYGLGVWQGLWLSSDPVANKREIEAAVALANAHPETVKAIVVGNEVLLRHDLTPEALQAYIADVRARVKVSVTYADVWEFWLKHPQIAQSVDFLSIHILPFWEDDPVAADEAAAHVASIYGRMQSAFPGRKIVIGEVGWPSAGRMREGALPSPANQARVLHDVVAWSKAAGTDANIIEAFDQPWKQQLEGTVGGHWGLFDADDRDMKFAWGSPVSNHPHWRCWMAVGVLFAGLYFIAAARAPEFRHRVPAGRVVLLSSVAVSGGIGLGLALESAAHAAFDMATTLKWVALVMPLLFSPMAAAAVAEGTALPPLTWIMSQPLVGLERWTRWSAGALAALTIVLALVIAMQLVFDPRYHEFPWPLLLPPVLTLAAVRFAASSRITQWQEARHAETAAAALLLASAFYIALNEGHSNWQAATTAATLGLLGLMLAIGDQPTGRASAKTKRASASPESETL